MPRNDDPNLMKFRLSGLPQNLDRNQVQQELEGLTNLKFADCYYIPTSKFDDAVDTICYLKIKPEEEQQLWVLDRTTILDGAREARLKWMDGPPSAGNQGGGGGGGGFKRPQNFDNDDANKRAATGAGGGIPGPAVNRPAVCLCYATIDATGRHIWAPLTDPVTFDNESVSRVFSGASTINGGASTTVNQYFTSNGQANGGGDRGGFRGGRGGGGGRGGSPYVPRGGGRGGGGGGGGGGWGGNGGGGTPTATNGGGGGGWDDEPAKPAAPATNGDAKSNAGDDWGGGGDDASSTASATPAKAAEPAKKEEPAAASDNW